MNHEKLTLAERGLCAMYAISSDRFAELMHETGCLYAERNYPKSAKHLIRSTVFWARWSQRWAEVVCKFIAWNNPEKSLVDLCRLATDKEALMHRHRFYIDKYPVP